MVFLFVAFMLVLVVGIFKSRAAARMERKVNRLLGHAGIEFDPYKSLPHERGVVAASVRT